jgi:hypothetical protein
MPVLAGSLAAGVFAASTLPMLIKARRTQDVSSYSLGNVALANAVNLVYSVHVVHLPRGPVWAFMHSRPRAPG